MHSFPSLFISHGAPTLAVDDGPAHRFLREWGAALGRPQGILLLSAHFDVPTATVTAGTQPGTIHDFGGFPKGLYEINYPAPGHPELAATVAELLRADAIDVLLDRDRGFDHGAWVPMLLMYPEADVPLVQLSINSRRDTTYHKRLGKLLEPLRQDGILTIGSGGATHNLAAFFDGQQRGETPAWVSDFNEWLFESLVSGNVENLLHYRERGPGATRNHPTAEHFLPLLSAVGAAGDAPGRRVHHSYAHGVLSMDAYQFGDV